MIDIEDATRSVVRFLEANILGVGVKDAANNNESDLGKPILSREYPANKGISRVRPAPPDAKWIQASVPCLAFWEIGFNPKLDYHIKKKVIEKDEPQIKVDTRMEFYRARYLLQAEFYTRTNYERQRMSAQISTLLNTMSNGTGRLQTIKGDFIYLKMLGMNSPTENDLQSQNVYRLVMTLEMAVRDLVAVNEPMFRTMRLNASLQPKNQ